MRILLGLIACGFVAFLFMVVFNYFFSSAARETRVSKKELQKSLTDAKARERIATKALRQVANGSGSPILEAQIALDEIEQTYDSKEIA